MQFRGRIFRVAAVGAVVVTSAVGFSGLTAGAASAPTVVNPGSSGRAHPAVVAGTYELFVNGGDIGPLVLNSDLSFNITDVGDTGVWITTGTSFAMSITISPTNDVGCTFSGKTNKKGINAKGKKQGNYTCPNEGGPVFKWYAVKQ